MHLICVTDNWRKKLLLTRNNVINNKKSLEETLIEVINDFLLEFQIKNKQDI